MSLMLMFPGQGAQRPGMLHALPATAEVSQTLQEASEILQEDCLLLDSAAALNSTYSVQLCLLIAGVAMARVLAARQVIPSMVAGLSIGAFPAAVVSGALDYADAIRLVQLRARLMEQTYPHGYGMAAMTGLDRAALEKLLALVHSEQTPVYLANLNAPAQFVISGSIPALEHCLLLARAAGATKALLLDVRVPSHCPLFSAAAQQLQTVLTPLVLRRPLITYLSASAARALHDPFWIKNDLATNMAQQVHWFDTMRLAWERGARLAIEMPGGSVLTQLTTAQWTDGMALACDTARLDTLFVLAERELSR